MNTILDKQDKPVEEMLKELQGKLREVTELAAHIAAKVESDKKAAAVMPLHAKEPNGFLVPSLAGGFNRVTSTAETKVVPTDVYRFSKGADLEDFRNVLLGLACPATHDSNRDAIFIGGYKGSLKPAHISALAAPDMTAGKATIGFNVAAVTAANANQATVDLYVVEDSMRGKMIIAGSEDIPATLKSALREQGVEYVNRRDESSVTWINEFLADGAKWRGQQGKLIAGNTQNIIESMLHALGSYTGTSQAGAGGVTMGLAIHRAPEHAARSAQITRPK